MKVQYLGVSLLLAANNTKGFTSQFGRNYVSRLATKKHDTDDAMFQDLFYDKTGQDPNADKDVFRLSVPVPHKENAVKAKIKKIFNSISVPIFPMQLTESIMNKLDNLFINNVVDKIIRPERAKQVLSIALKEQWPDLEVLKNRTEYATNNTILSKILNSSIELDRPISNLDLWVPLTQKDLLVIGSKDAHKYLNQIFIHSEDFDMLQFKAATILGNKGDDVYGSLECLLDECDFDPEFFKETLIFKEMGKSFDLKDGIVLKSDNLYCFFTIAKDSKGFRQLRLQDIQNFSQDISDSLP